jgi:hypothetical protein
MRRRARAASFGRRPLAGSPGGRPHWASTVRLSYNAGVKPSATAEGTVWVQDFFGLLAMAQGPGAGRPPQRSAA